MDAKLLAILVCPLCKATLHFDKSKQELICRADRLAYPIHEGIPIMLAHDARTLEVDEVIPD